MRHFNKTNVYAVHVCIYVCMYTYSNYCKHPKKPADITIIQFYLNYYNYKINIIYF